VTLTDDEPPYDDRYDEPGAYPDPDEVPPLDHQPATPVEPHHRPARHLTAVPIEAPRNDDAIEAHLLGAAMLSTAARDHLATVDPADFARPSHQAIAHAINTLHAQGAPVDTSILANHLAHSGQLDAIGGPGTLLTITAGTPATSSAPRYAAVVRQLAQLRRLAHIGTEITAAARSLSADPSTVATAAQELLDQLQDANADHDHLTSVADALDGYVDLLEARQEIDLAGITTGLDALDRRTGGLQDSRLYTIAGRPGLGKSDIATHLAKAAAQAGRRVLVVSIEMTRHEVIDRWIAGISRVQATNLTNGQIADRDWERINPAVVRLAGLPLWIDDDPSATVASIRAHARRVSAELIVVDYLQLVEVAKAESRQIEVTNLARALKRLARDLEVPVVALAQLNRGVEARMEKRPMLSDLRESGAIEQESDVVIGLYRDDYYRSDSDQKGIMEMLLLKNRTGPTTTVKVAYDPATKLVANLDGHL